MDLIRQHRETVTEISNIINELFKQGSRIVIRKATPSHTPHDFEYKKSCKQVDVSQLCNILEIDTENREILVQGQVNLGQVAAATLPKGFILPVVPEFSTFTVAGLVNGQGIQSSSHRYGLFTDGLLAVECVLGDGTVVYTERDEPIQGKGASECADFYRLRRQGSRARPHAAVVRTASECGGSGLNLTEQDRLKIFHSIQCSHGTLGIVTCVRIRLIPCLPFVRSIYHQFDTVDSLVEALREEVEQDNSHFVDAVAYGANHFTMVTSDFVDAKTVELEELNVYHPADPEKLGVEYYYQYVRHTKARAIGEDAIPTHEFLFRPMRGNWWVLEALTPTIFAQTNWGRRVSDRANDQRLVKYGFNGPGVTVEERERSVVLQDLGIPLSRVADGIRYVQRELSVYPLWLCVTQCVSPHPLRVFDHPTDQHRFLVDIGIYGVPQVPKYQNRRQMRALQNFVEHPSVWGVSYLTPQELRRMYRYDDYISLRHLVCADKSFPTIEDKVVFYNPDKAEQGPQRGLKVFMMWRSAPGFTVCLSVGFALLLLGLWQFAPWLLLLLLPLLYLSA